MDKFGVLSTHLVVQTHHASIFLQPSAQHGDLGVTPETAGQRAPAAAVPMAANACGLAAGIFARRSGANQRLIQLATMSALLSIGETRHGSGVISARKPAQCPTKAGSGGP